jgi:single-strand DNA-binding protein
VASYNRIIIVGNLTKDPELKQIGGGQQVCRMSIASNRQFRNKQTGAQTQEVCYVDVDVWGPQAENCKQYLAKGRPVLIEGRLKLDTWKDNEGQTRSKHSIVAERVVFLGSSQAAELSSMDGLNEEASSAPTPKGRTSEAAGALFKDEAPFEDDLPF